MHVLAMLSIHKTLQINEYDIIYVYNYIYIYITWKKTTGNFIFDKKLEIDS